MIALSVVAVVTAIAVIVLAVFLFEKLTSPDRSPPTRQRRSDGGWQERVVAVDDVRFDVVASKTL